jgi:diketogulonate reductase-like aldo/keto reductase
MSSRVVQDLAVPSFRPRFLYGTAWKEARTEALTALALRAGFRGIDTANQRRHYVESAVGDAVAAATQSGDLKREDLFLQTKFTYVAGQDERLPYDPRAEPAAQVRQSFESSLEHLRTTYVDSYVLHGPSTRRGLAATDLTVWQAMEGIHGEGRARVLGVSNVSLEQLELLCDKAKVAPAFVQNRCFATTGWDRAVRSFCAQRGIVYQGFSLLTANARELAAPAFQRIVERTQRTPAQVVFRFALSVGMLPLTGTSSAVHMKEDLAATEVELTDAELHAIEHLVG